MKDTLSRLAQKKQEKVSPLDGKRRAALYALTQKTKRNAILFYSGWLQQSSTPLQALIYDGDINSFMEVTSGLDRAKGLDLILHTPGGRVGATEALVCFLRKLFHNNIRCFIPQVALSGGTMLACACNEIYMGQASSIGPIDPQFGEMAAWAVLDEFNKAADEILACSQKIPLWQAIYSKMPAGFLTECQQAVDRSASLVSDWLKTGMFSKDQNAESKAKRIVEFLNNHQATQAHDRHIDALHAKKIGLNVSELEKDPELCMRINNIHFLCMSTFSKAHGLHKIIENQNGIGKFIWE